MADITMKWKSWYGNENITINLPEMWDVEIIKTKSAQVMTDNEIRKVILSPTGCRPLSQEVKNKQTVCITIDDLTKPTEIYKTAPIVIEELLKGGVKRENIFFLVSLGTHRACTLPDLKKKLGDDIALNFRVYNHNPYQNNIYIGDTSRGTKLYINKFFMDADYKIAIGMLMPHNLAGFSGGGKIVLPGLSSIETIEENHRSTLRGLQGNIGCLEGNQVRADIDEAAEKAGLNFIINSLHGDTGETVKLFCGDPNETYRIAVNEAIDIYSCTPRYNNDIGIFNAFPRDNWFLLSLSSLDVWSTRDKDKEIVSPDGTIVIINNCSEGSGGEHGLHGKGMKHHVMRNEHGTFKDILINRELIFFSPNINMGIIKDYYKKNAILCRKWEEVIAILREKYINSAKVAVFPCGTLMMDKAVIKK